MHALTLAAVLALFVTQAAPSKPSRKPEEGCQWQKLSDASVGLEAWVQKCDFGFRKIDFVFVKNALSIRYSDGGEPSPVVEVFSLKDRETAAAGIQRVLAERTPKAIASRCVVVPVKNGTPPAGATWLTFEPNAAYEAELKKAPPNGVPPPPCGDWGTDFSGIRYWEAHAGASRVLFVRVGQETPLYDEQTLRLLPAR